MPRISGSPQNVFLALTQIGIDQQPSETSLYTSVRRRLQTICESRESHSCEPATVLPIPDQEEVEALRIYGSAEHGFGTLPNVIEVLLTGAGRTTRDCRRRASREKMFGGKDGITGGVNYPEALDSVVSVPVSQLRDFGVGKFDKRKTEKKRYTDFAGTMLPNNRATAGKRKARKATAIGIRTRES